MLNRSIGVLNHHRSSLSVELKEALSESSLHVEGSDGEQFDRQGLSLLDRDGHFIVDLRLAEEVSGGND